ncbi:hypothetical protein TWF481_004180 [Arthrobotrys musiformis]|uniref:NB-ARC domain-containing protein n=1 Tax=Arthrobotrys musiformis TaxID=47236 RepID=A0AAV9WJW0_9PEZI
MVSLTRFLPQSADPGGYQYGVNVLSPGVDPVVDIILVHGLGGDPFKTWTHSGGKKEPSVLWPRDLLALEIPEVRILSYGYDTKVTSWFEGATSNMIHHHSETMISRLHNFRSRKIDGKNSTERPIIWIGHSLGGILIKRALIYSNSCGVDHNERLRSIRVSTQGILFMGTPHMGSDIVRWASLARKLLLFFPGVKLDSTMLSMLGQNSETLQNINTLFTGIASSFEIVYFYEEIETVLPTGQREVIVPYSSAIVDSPNTEKIGIHATHHTMIKYKDESSPGYSDVAGILRQMVDNALTFAPGRWESERRSAVAATDEKIKEILVQRGPAIPQPEEYSPESSIILPPSLPIFAVPLHPNESPVTREYLLYDLDRILLAEDRRSKGNAGLLLWGPPGSGKTHLVREYVFSRRPIYTGGIFWVNARTPSSRVDSFRHIYKKLNLPSAVMQDITAPHTDRSGMDLCTCRVLEWMERNENWLLVLDGANAVTEIEIDELKACMPTSQGGSILFTSLNQSLDGQARLGAPVGFKIPQMTTKEAVSILLTEAKILDPTPQEVKVAQELVELLDHLIGAIHIAACYIAERQVSIYEYLRGYKEHPKVSGDGWSPLAMTLDTLETKHPEAANLLKLISYFGTDIPTLLIHWGLEALPAQVRVVAKEEDGIFDFNLTIKHLLAFSLVRRTHQNERENGKEWRVDRLHLQNVIQTYVRQRLSSQAEVGQAWVKFAALVFRHAFERAEKQRGSNGSIYVKDYEEFVRHGEALMNYMREGKVSRKSIRATVEMTKQVIEEQIKAQGAGKLVELPPRSIWGRTDTESPEAVFTSRRSTFNDGSSVTGSSLSASTLSELSKGNAFSVGNNSKVTQEEEQKTDEAPPAPAAVEPVPAPVPNNDTSKSTLSRASTSTTIQGSTTSTKAGKQRNKLQRRPSHKSYKSRKGKEVDERLRPPKPEGPIPSIPTSATIGTQTQAVAIGTSTIKRQVSAPYPISQPSGYGSNNPFTIPNWPNFETSPLDIPLPLPQHVPQVYTDDIISQSAPSNLYRLYRKSEVPNSTSLPPARTVSEPVRDPGPNQPLPRTIRRRKAVDPSPTPPPQPKTPRLDTTLSPIPPFLSADHHHLASPMGYFYAVDHQQTHSENHDEEEEEDLISVTSESGPSRISRGRLSPNPLMRHKVLYNTPASSTAVVGPSRLKPPAPPSPLQSHSEIFLSAPTSPILSRMSSTITNYGNDDDDGASMQPSPGSLVNLAKNFTSWAGTSLRSRGSSVSSFGTVSPMVRVERRRSVSISREGSPSRGRNHWGTLA